MRASNLASWLFSLTTESVAWADEFVGRHPALVRSVMCQLAMISSSVVCFEELLRGGVAAERREVVQVACDHPVGILGKFALPCFGLNGAVVVEFDLRGWLCFLLPIHFHRITMTDPLLEIGLSQAEHLSRAVVHCRTFLITSIVIIFNNPIMMPALVRTNHDDGASEPWFSMALLFADVKAVMDGLRRDLLRYFFQNLNHKKLLVGA